MGPEHWLCLRLGDAGSLDEPDRASFRVQGLSQKSGESMEAVVLDGNLSTRYGGGPPPPARLRRMIRIKRQALQAAYCRRERGRGRSPK